MKARKSRVNLKSCAGTFFYAHGVLIFLGVFFVLFCFHNGWDKEVYVPRSQFPSFYRSMYSINVTLANLLWFHFCRNPSKTTLISKLFPLHILIYRMVSCTHAFVKSTAQKLVVLGPWRPCSAQISPVYCWCSFGSHLPCCAHQVEKRFGCIWDYLAIWRLYSGLLFYGAQSCSTEIEESLALDHMWGRRRLQSAYPLDISTALLPAALPHSASLGTSPVLSPNWHLPSASCIYPALFATLPCHFWPN